jgi:hypothetical protein
MDEDVKARFEDTEKRLLASDKRFDDMKWYFGGVTTLFTVGFSVLTLILSWNYSNEKASLREFQNDMKVELGKIDAPPEIQLLGIDGQPLAGQELPAQFKQEESGELLLVINHFLRNSGAGLSGPMYVKVYASDPVVLHSRSTDESKFKYEATIIPSNLSPSEIPGQYSTEWFHNVYLPEKKRPPKGKYDVMVKVYYGKGRVSQARFRLNVE